MPDASETKIAPVADRSPGQPEVVLGTLVGFDEAAMPQVDWPGNPGRRPVTALCTGVYTPADQGRMVALLFAAGEPPRPLIVGLVNSPIDAVIEATEQSDTADGQAENRPTEISVRADDSGERVIIAADKEIVLQCGKASITLTRAGKILLRGAYLLSRSSGANRIKGGSVQIN